MTQNISSELTKMSNATARTQANKETSNEMDQDMFLKLMLEQLKYQDPLNPTSNQDFLAQQAAFTQVEQLTKLNETITANNTLTQGIGLIGKEVAITDPNNAKNTIVGIVESASFYNNECAVVVGGKEYPVSYIQAARNVQEKTAEDATPSTPSENNITTDDTTKNKETASTQSLSRKLTSVAAEMPILSQITNTVNSISEKLQGQ